MSAGTATSAADLGGMDALVAAAKKEGQLNVIALPPDWANYGEIIEAFTAKYGIKINSENPDGSSADEINAVKTRKGQDRAPDVVDLGTAFALSGATENLFAPYKVADLGQHPRRPEGRRRPLVQRLRRLHLHRLRRRQDRDLPDDFADLLKPEYKGKVALNGNPTKSGSAFAGVYAAALANGGSFDDIQPGIDFFEKLKKDGNFIPVESTPATVEKGETPIIIDWDYLNAGYATEFKAKGVDWKIVVPTDGVVLRLLRPGRSTRTPRTRPPPACGRSSSTARGPEPLAQGLARPVRCRRHEQAGTVDKAARGTLPEVDGTPVLPDRAEQSKAKAVLDAELGQGRSG